MKDITMGAGSTREAKKRVFELLAEDDFDRAISEITRMDRNKVVNYLISALCCCEPLIKWRAVSALGKVVSYLADEDLETARVIMRRFMWMLNDESGGIGWGVPESMAEIMACHKDLGTEYAPILVSYLREDGNFLEYEPLQRGLMWGIGRLGYMRPNLLKSLEVEEYLPGFLEANDLEVRALAAWACGILNVESVKEVLEKMKENTDTILFYWNGVLEEKTVGELIRNAISINNGNF